jgi:hypothetical protein
VVACHMLRHSKGEVQGTICMEHANCNVQRARTQQGIMGMSRQVLTG